MSVTPVDEHKLEELLEKVPILQDKMIVDLVNGIEVTHDHIRVREVRNQNLFHRIWDRISGQADNRQQQIDQNMASGLAAAANWLQHLQAKQIRSDRALAHVANKLLETREGVQRLAASHMELRLEVQVLSDQLEDLEHRFQLQMNELHLKMQAMDRRQSAMAQMSREFDKWESGRYREFSPTTQLLIVLETLSWGSFGLYDDLNPEFRDQLFDKCMIMLKRFGGVTERMRPTVDWLVPMIQERTTTKEMLGYLLLGNQEEVQPGTISGLLSKAISSEPDSPDLLPKLHTMVQKQNLPYVLNSRSLGRRLYLESRQRLESEGHCVSSL